MEDRSAQGGERAEGPVDGNARAPGAFASDGTPSLRIAIKDTKRVLGVLLTDGVCSVVGSGGINDQPCSAEVQSTKRRSSRAAITMGLTASCKGCTW